MMGGWRLETTGAVACIALIPWWVWVPGLNTQRDWLVIFAVIVGLGIGCGLAGVRRGSRDSRFVSGVCLAVLQVVGIGYTALLRLGP